MSIASFRAAEVGEPRRSPEGPGHGHNGFGYFCRNKSDSPAGAKPGIIRTGMNQLLLKKDVRIEEDSKLLTSWIALIPIGQF